MHLARNTKARTAGQIRADAAGAHFIDSMLDQSNTYKHPRPGLIGRVLTKLVNSRKLARTRYAVLSKIPFLKLDSDVTDVVYLTWVLDVSEVQTLVPPGTVLWQKDGKTPFTILTYKHGNFGPGFIGPLRRLFPSPMQSNWRLYLDDGSVYFVKNVMSSVAYTFATRMFSDIMKTHLAGKFAHVRSSKGFEIDIQCGDGSSPELRCAVERVQKKELAPPFSEMFGSWDSAVAYLACQDSAVSFAERMDRIVKAEIQLPISLEQVVPLDIAADTAACSFLDHFTGMESPFCFLVPSVKFRVISEKLAPIAPIASIAP